MKRFHSLVIPLKEQFICSYKTALLPLPGRMIQFLWSIEHQIVLCQ